MFISNTTIKKLTCTELGNLGYSNLGCKPFRLRTAFKKRTPGFSIVKMAEDEVIYASDRLQFEFVKVIDTHFKGVWVYRVFDKVDCIYQKELDDFYVYFVKA